MGVKVDLGALVALEKRLRGMPAKADQAVQRARSTLARRLPVEARRDIGAEYNLKASRIRRDLRSVPTETGVELRGRRRFVGAIDFGGKWRRSSPGATYQIKRGGARETVRGGFIATGLSGNRQIFTRVGTPRRMRMGRYVGQTKQPLQSVQGPRVGDMLADAARRERLIDYSRDILRSEMARLLD